MLSAGERLEALMLQDQLMQSHSGVLSEAKDLWFRILRYREDNPATPNTLMRSQHLIDVLLLQMEELPLHFQMEELPLHFMQRQLLLELWREQYEDSK